MAPITPAVASADSLRSELAEANGIIDYDKKRKKEKKTTVA